MQEAEPPKRRRLRIPLIPVLAVLVACAVAGLAVGTFFLGRHEGSTSSKSASASTATSTNSGARTYDFATLNQIMDILKAQYVKPDNLDEQTLYDAAINGMLGTLNDLGTYYLDPDTYKVNNTPSGTFDGIGLTIAQQNGDIVVVSPIKGTPAESAGIKAGDVVVAVDGESAKGWTADKAAATIRGQRGTKVTITIRHPDNSSQDYSLTRAQVPIESVSSTPPGGTLKDSAGNPVKDIGYIQIQQFTQRTPVEIQQAVKDVLNGGAKGLVLDMRGNPGGVLDETISIADMFLDSGTILTQRDRDGHEQSVAARPGQVVPKNMPIVILLDKYSFSASEVLSAALHDNGRATIVGETSGGKGTINTPVALKDHGGLYVSIGEWLTPKGQLIDHAGIRPDIEVIPTNDDIDARRDVQLFKAIDVLHGLLAAAPGSTQTSTP